jgi:hypothetical protein
MLQVLSTDKVSSYVFEETKYIREEKDGRIVFKLKPGNEGRNRPTIISVQLDSEPKMMYRLFCDDFIDSEEILGLI